MFVIDVFLSATELKFRADYNSTPCGVGIIVIVGVVVVGVVVVGVEGSN